MANLTTKEKVKTYLGLSGTTYDTLLDEIIKNISNQIEVFCNRNFEQDDYTEYFDTAYGDTKVFVKAYPLESITSVSTRSGTFGNPSWIALNSNDYLLNENGKISFAFKLPDAERYLKVVYTGGYLIDFTDELDPTAHTLPASLTQIATEFVAKNFNLRKTSGILSETTEGQSVTFKSADTEIDDAYLTKRLAQFRNFNI